MTQVFRVDPAWVDDEPNRVRDRRIREGLITVALLATCWFIHAILFWGVVAVAVIYWLFDILSPVAAGKAREFADEYRVELRDDGLYRYHRNSNGKPISVLSPWPKLELQDVRRRKDHVTRIRLIDTELPRGARTIDLEYLDDMDSLLLEVETRLIGGIRE